MKNWLDLVIPLRCSLDKKEREMTRAIIGTRSDNERMLSLARKAGFSIDHSRLWFSKSTA